MDGVFTGPRRESTGEHTDMGTAARQLPLLQKVLAWGDTWRSSRIDRSLLVQTLPENAAAEILRQKNVENVSVIDEVQERVCVDCMIPPKFDGKEEYCSGCKQMVAFAQFGGVTRKRIIEGNHGY